MATWATSHHCAHCQRRSGKRRPTKAHSNLSLRLQSMDGSQEKQHQTMGDQTQRWQIHLTRDT
eukprot:3181417-Heterocapsa_arctica.AAC.1